jgi:hypothetical protein
VSGRIEIEESALQHLYFVETELQLQKAAAAVDAE